WRATRLRTPEQIMRAACSGVLFKPLTMIVLESTANGTGNFFHREYESAKSGESQFRSLFVSWYDIDQYSEPLDDAEAFAQQLLEEREAKLAASSRRQPGAYLWWLWQKGATLEALNWYVNERSKYSDHGLMAAEYPSDDIEAFVHSGARVFDKYQVEALREGCRITPRKGEIDGDTPGGPQSLRNVRFNPDSNGGLKIWKDRAIPQQGFKTLNRYLVVVDIGGRSVQADWSVVTVFDRDGMESGKLPEVAAQWRGHTDIDLLAWNAARIATYYDNALLVIESNTLDTRDPARLVDGDQSSFIINQLREAYPNLYARKQSVEDVQQGLPRKYGFHTNTATKPMIISG
ncbi:MAG: terminase, partial [Muribaculaceae bacterium]|nr:terminase [Muribaculaceae bacterium]